MKKIITKEGRREKRLKRKYKKEGEAPKPLGKGKTSPKGVNDEVFPLHY